MAESLARIDVVATVVYCGPQLLTVFNPSWGGFTLPMTKIRQWPLGLDATRRRWERGQEAAMRNVAECLGITSVVQPRLLTDVGGLYQSDRSGKINQYLFQVYAFPVEQKQAASTGTAQWLEVDEILDVRRQPISPTARNLLQALREAAFQRDTQFPPPARTGRTSAASVAIIARGQGTSRSWLCRWNENWGRYFLVGGHRKEDEAPQQCLVREIKEELQLDPDAFRYQVRQELQYEDWSTGAWETTHYAIATFAVQLEPSAEKAVERDPANRWATAEEIQAERCSDDRLLSPTARKILTRLGEI